MQVVFIPFLAEIAIRNTLGQTGKELSTRLGQHKYSIRTAQASSALFIHLSNFNHVIDWINAKEILYCKDITSRNIIESGFIKEFSANLLNVSPGMYKLDNFMISEIVKRFKISL